jgi:hypothetical protein
MTRITFIMRGLRIEMTVTATIRYGSARKASVTRMRRRSTQPLYTPLMTAMNTPSAPATRTARKPTVTEIRAP